MKLTDKLVDLTQRGCERRRLRSWTRGILWILSVLFVLFALLALNSWLLRKRAA